MNINKLEIYRSSAVAFIIKGISIVLGYVFSYLIALYYGAQGMGIFSITQTLISILAIISILGFDVAIVKFFSEKKSVSRIKEMYYKILKIVIPLALFVSIITYLSSPLLKDFFNDEDLLYSIRIASFGIFPLSVLFINSEGLRGMKDIKLYSIFKFVMIPLVSSMILLFVYKSQLLDFEGIIFSYVVGIYITFFFSMFFWLKKINVPSSYNSVSSFKNLLNISIPMLLTTSLFYIINWTDTIILGYYDTSYNIGIYNIAVKMSMASSIVLFSINSIAAPKYSELFSLNKMSEFKSMVKFSSKLIFWISVPIIIIIAYKAEFFLSIFGEEFKQGKIALYILLLGQLVNIICGSVGYILMMTNKQNLLRNIIFLAALVNIILNILLIPSYGILGAALSTTISMILWNITSLIYVYKEYGFITTNILR